MRILFILTTLGIGGAERQALSLAERMSERGHVVAILSLKHVDEEWPVKLPVLRLNMSKSVSGIRRGLAFAKNFLAAFQPDILHSHTFPANIFSRLLKASGAKASVVNTIHNVYEGGWHRVLLYRLTDPLADRVTAVSTAVLESFRKSGAANKRKFSLLTNGIDTDVFQPDRGRRKRTRLRMQAGSDFIWLAVGRIAPAKDYPNLIRAFRQTHVSKPDMQLWIAGEGDSSSVFSAVEFVSDVKGHDSHIHFLGLQRDIPSLLDAADGYVLSSAWEGMPLALGEAMAMEKLVVATDVGGVRELAGEQGIVVPARDDRALAEGMLKLMTIDQSTRKFKGHAARERIANNFSIQSKSAEWERVYMAFDRATQR